MNHGATLTNILAKPICYLFKRQKELQRIGLEDVSKRLIVRTRMSVKLSSFNLTKSSCDFKTCYSIKITWSIQFREINDLIPSTLICNNFSVKIFHFLIVKTLNFSR